MFKKSIAMRIISAITLMLVVGIGVLLFIQGSLTTRFFADEFKKSYQAKTVLFAEQMAGGIKWKRANAIEASFAREVDPATRTNLIDILVTDSDLASLVSYTHPEEEETDLATLLKDNREKLADKDSLTIEDSEKIITLVPSIDGKSGEANGYVVMAWSKEEALRTLASMRKTTMAISAVIMLSFILALVFMLQKMAIKPIKLLQGVMAELANGNNKIDIPFCEKQDEIGVMARSVKVFKENAIEKEMLEAEQAEAAKRAEQEKRQAMDNLAKTFDTQVGGLIESLAGAATQLQATADSMKHIADETSQASQHVAASSEEASANVNTVASAMEEMSASASEIGTQIVGARNKSNDTFENAQQANKTVSDLNNLVENIGQVVIAIQDIAEQTNLLALNATIEAARAGEAGKGFAVVADEVKKLANETANKTSEINSQITGIQEATRQSVTAMERIIANISDIDNSVTGVSAAVEEQNATTTEIVRSVAEASQGVQQVAEVILEVQKGANETGLSADAVLNASREMSKLSDNLKASVQAFLKEIKA